MAEPKKTLTLFDSTCLVVGIIVGAGIFETAPDVARGGGSAAGIMALWAIGGLLSLAGALCYAELAAAWPREGGDYVYLSRAYGRWAGFLFGWIQMAVVRPGDVALMAFVFARHGAALVAPGVDLNRGAGLAWLLALACGAVVVFSIVNALGVRQGKWTQNTLTVAKILGIAVILVAALLVDAPAPRPGTPPPPADAQSPWLVLALAMVLIRVLYTYGGWNEMAYVAAEVKRPERNILRALVLGTAAVAGLYLLVNAAFLRLLGFEGLAYSKAVGADVGRAICPRWGSQFMAGLICVSALGALNGLIFAGSRIAYALGSEHRLFAPLGRWNPKTGTPVWSILVQAALAIAMIVGFGSFARTILVTSAAVYCFYMATGMSVIVLRRREPDAPRPYRVTGYPVVPLVFAACCGLLIVGALLYKPLEAGISATILLAGLPIYWVSAYVGRRS